MVGALGGLSAVCLRCKVQGRQETVKSKVQNTLYARPTRRPTRKYSCATLEQHQHIAMSAYQAAYGS